MKKAKNVIGYYALTDPIKENFPTDLVAESVTEYLSGVPRFYAKMVIEYLTGVK